MRLRGSEREVERLAKLESHPATRRRRRLKSRKKARSLETNLYWLESDDLTNFPRSPFRALGVKVH
ncbi:MAG: hypothetical protein ACI93R_003638 [Flavobacteriales bacterium]|jgi:hypothetical protein